MQDAGALCAQTKVSTGNITRELPFKDFRLEKFCFSVGATPAFERKNTTTDFSQNCICFFIHFQLHIVSVRKKIDKKFHFLKKYTVFLGTSTKVPNKSFGVGIAS